MGRDRGRGKSGGLEEVAASKGEGHGGLAHLKKWQGLFWTVGMRETIGLKFRREHEVVSWLR